MLIASPLGQTITPVEVAAEIIARGYYPLPVTPPPPASPPIYSITPAPVTPPVMLPGVSIRYIEPLTLPAEPTPWPSTPQPSLPIIAPLPSLTRPILTITPSDPRNRVPWPSITQPSLPDSPPLFEPKWEPASPAVILPDSPPTDWPFIDPDIPQFIIDDFPGITVQADPGDVWDRPLLLPDTLPVEQFIEWPSLTPGVELPVSPPAIIEEFPPEKETPWLIILVIGGILLFAGEKEKTPKRPRRRPEVMREEYVI